MRITLAIAATEILNRSHPGYLEKDTRPLMFEMFRFVADPGLPERDVLPQIIDVPVLAFVRL